MLNDTFREKNDMQFFLIFPLSNKEKLCLLFTHQRSFSFFLYIFDLDSVSNNTTNHWTEILFRIFKCHRLLLELLCDVLLVFHSFCGCHIYLPEWYLTCNVHFIGSEFVTFIHVIFLFLILHQGCKVCRTKFTKTAV